MSVNFSPTSPSGYRQCKADAELHSCPRCMLLPIFCSATLRAWPWCLWAHAALWPPSVLMQGQVSGATPPPSLCDVQEEAHTPSTYITGPHLAAQVSGNEVFIRSSPVPTKSQRLPYSRKGHDPSARGTPHRCFSQFSLPVCPQASRSSDGRKWEGGRDKSLQEDRDSELITSAREFLG